MSGYQNEEDLDDIYSDLSDKEQDKQVPKITPSTVPNQPAPKGNMIRMPAFFGGKAFIPPPPPPSSRPPAKIQSSDEVIPARNQNSNFQHGNQGQRERKNIVYLKNLPKTYNRQETLTTFFRTYGNIKSIKTNQQNNSAFVRFQKEQDVYKFMNLKPMILNRSYIMYETNEDFIVLPQKIAQREKQQNAVLMISSQKQLMVLRENTESILADKYRALLFLRKNKNKLTGKHDDYLEQNIEQLNRQIAKCHKIKELENDVQALSEILTTFENQYDWTLSYKIITKQSVDKKKIINQLQKYGPINTITVKLANITGEENAPQSQQQIQKVQSSQDKQAMIKIKFLGVRSSWEMFMQNHEKLEISIQGNRLQEIYKNWLTNVIKQKAQANEDPVLENINKQIQQKQQTNKQQQKVKQQQIQNKDIKIEADQNVKQTANEKINQL